MSNKCLCESATIRTLFCPECGRGRSIPPLVGLLAHCRRITFRILAEYERTKNAGLSEEDEIEKLEKITERSVKWCHWVEGLEDVLKGPRRK